MCKFGAVFYILKSFRVRKITLHPKEMLLRQVVYQGWSQAMHSLEWVSFIAEDSPCLISVFRITPSLWHRKPTYGYIKTRFCLREGKPNLVSGKQW